jgi:hypothetical protein
MRRNYCFLERQIERWSYQRMLIVAAYILCACMMPLGAVYSWSQSPETTRQELQSRVDAMQIQLDTAQRRIAQEHEELVELQQQFKDLKSQIQPAMEGARSAPPTEAVEDLQQAVAEIQERQAIHQAEIQVHEQEKIESSSKFPLKLHGMVLLNSSVNNGSVDNAIQPVIAISSDATAADGSVTATGRQTLLGLDATGPLLWGAHTYANLEMDFAGGTSSGGYTSGSSSVRLRTASMQIEWPKTKVQAGIFPLILTPYYASSYFSITVPAMSWSGAIWGWLPQLSVEHTLGISGHQHLDFQAAVTDVPDAGPNVSDSLGSVSAAERSRYPATETRVAWQSTFRLPASIGIGGYWSPHSLAATSANPACNFNAWAATADWKLSLPASFWFSGSIYDGAALGGLSAGAFKDSILVYRAVNAQNLENLTGLKDAGGWSQLKFKPIQRLEFNVAFGEDSANSAQLRSADLNISNPYIGLVRNQTGFANFVFRPTSTILLSGEYRKIRSWQIMGSAADASLFGLAAGYAF